MYCLDYAERPQPDNQPSVMLHELVFFGYHSDSLCVRTHSLRTGKVVKFYNYTLRLRCGCIPMGCFSNRNIHNKLMPRINARQQIVVLYKPFSLRIRQPDTCELAFSPLSSVKQSGKWTQLDQTKWMQMHWGLRKLRTWPSTWSFVFFSVPQRNTFIHSISVFITFSSFLLTELLLLPALRFNFDRINQDRYVIIDFKIRRQVIPN